VLSVCGCGVAAGMTWVGLLGDDVADGAVLAAAVDVGTGKLLVAGRLIHAVSSMRFATTKLIAPKGRFFISIRYHLEL